MTTALVVLQGDRLHSAAGTINWGQVITLPGSEAAHAATNSSATWKWKVPQGSTGRPTLLIQFDAHAEPWGTVKTQFWYEWNFSGPSPQEVQERFQAVPRSAGPDEMDSGVRFSDLSGQVEWRVDGDEEGWNFATLDDVLPIGAHIRCAERSTALLTFADMTSFVVTPQSEIILTSPLAKDSKVHLEGGMWVNLKKMWKDGSMEIEMGQAAASIKGTIFSATSRRGVSEVAVCQGLVTFTHKQTGQMIVLDPGKKGIASGRGLELVQVGAATVCDEYRAAAAVGSTPRDTDTPAVVFDNGNPGGIEAAGASRPTVFTLSRPHRITLIKNYHWNGGGSPAGQISLTGPAGTLGPWDAEGLSASGRANIYWVVRPNVVLPAGTYTVHDSNQSTWAQNTQSQHVGMTHVEGYPVK